MKKMQVNKTTLRRVAIVFFVLLELSFVQAQRTESNINIGWKYLELPFRSYAEAAAAEKWVDTDLPHSWNAEDTVDPIPGYRRSTSWYKKELNLEEVSNNRYILYFEGVNITTEVYINGRLAGEHIGGYVGFEIEITPFVKEGLNEVMVKVDNSYNPQIIPSQTSDFFIYGGITRDVWLKKLARTFVSDLKVTTPYVGDNSATVHLNLSVEGAVRDNTRLQLEVTDPQGSMVYKKRIKAQSTNQLKLEIKNPALWGVKKPQLYTVEASLLSEGNRIDQIQQRFGLRYFEFKEHGAFFLNGKRLLLRGTHRHEEHAGVGSAMSNEMHRRDMQMIKDMGANFVRLAHYPQDPEVYNMCDELGIIVWDELPWCRGGVGDQVWKENTRNLLSEMIIQNYNHPSVIFWSLGNEIYWLPDFENGDDPAAINAYLMELNELAHRLDPNRYTAIRKYYEGSHLVDVFSPSIWSGWYSGTYKNYEKVISQAIDKYPHFLHMEYGGASHLGRHTENPITGDGFVDPSAFEEEVNQIEVKSVAKSGDWSENYIVDLFDWYLHVTENQSRFAGNAQWAFKDFGTPLRPENDIPYINQKGLTDRAGNPKDAYYVFKSYWAEAPFAYIESHTWTERAGPKGVPRNVCVYSNTDVVELFHNGTSLGKKERDNSKFPAAGLNWDVSFASGNNSLEAIGYQKGKEVAKDMITIQYAYTKAGSPDNLQLKAEKLPDGNYLVKATVVDKDGARCLEYQERVYFQCLNGGELHRNQGTPIGSESIKMANGQAAIKVIPYGMEDLEVAVYNQNFKGTYLTIKKNEIEVDRGK